MAYWRDLNVKKEAIGGFRGLNESLSPMHRPLGVVSAVSNMVIEKPYALSTRPGLVAVGSAIAAAKVNGLHVYRNEAGTTVQLLAHVGTSLYKWDGSTWTSVGAGLTDGPSTSAMLNDTLCIFHGGTTKSWNGTTYGNLAGAPQGRYVVQEHQKLFVAGITGRMGDADNCDTGLPTGWALTSTNFAESRQASASQLKWIASDPLLRRILMWTEKELLAYLGPETPDRPDLWSVVPIAQYGTSAGTTIQNVNSVWIWLTDNAEGVGFAVWNGGAVEVERDPISTSLGLIDWANIASAQAWSDKKGRYYCYAPKSGGGALWFIRDPQYGWFMGSGAAIRSATSFAFSGREYSVVGDSNGNVYKVDGTDDNGTAIDWSVEIGPSALGDGFADTRLLELIPVMSKATTATANLALSAAESGAYETAYALSPGTTLNYQQVPLPLNSGGSRESNLFRLKISGSGVAEVHDMLIRSRKIGR